MLMRTPFVAAFLSSFLPVAAGTTAYVLSDDPVCNNNLGLHVSSLTCVDNYGGTSGQCDLGEELHVYGTLTIGDAGLPESAVMTTKACLMGLDWGALTCNIYTMEIDLCSYFKLYNEQGECPQEGSYSVYSQFKLPGQGGMSLYKSKLVRR